MSTRAIPLEEAARLERMRALNAAQRAVPKGQRWRLPVTMNPGDAVRNEVIPAEWTDAQLLDALRTVYGKQVAGAGERYKEQ